MKSATVSHYAVSGSYHTMGIAYGRLAASRIIDCYAFYTQSLMSIEGPLARKYGAAFLDVIAACAPNAAQQIAGIAEGSGLAPWQIAFLNARTEIFLMLTDRIPVECTSLYVPATTILAQNWDWLEQCESLFVLLEANPEEGVSYMTLTEPGMLAKIGCNAKGLGVCLNILRGKPTQCAVPIHVLVNMILALSSIDDVIPMLKALTLDTYSNLLVADAQGRFLMIELSGDTISIVRCGSAIPVHTNHYLSQTYTDEAIKDYQSSFARFNRANDIVGDEFNGDMDSVQSLLLDKANGAHSICGSYREYRATQTASPNRVGTVCSVAMDLSSQHFWMTAGSPLQHAFNRILPTY